MEIKQFEDKNLSQYGYAILNQGEMAVIDPARDPHPYYDFAKQNDARITAVIETHPHADFISSHLEIHESTGAPIYVSKLLDADYNFFGFDEGNTIKIGNILLRALNTPGHSPDSICILGVDENGKEVAVFTGDTLFIGDCGRPDLREKVGGIQAARVDLARQMYHSLRDKLLTLPNEVWVYPAHGAGSLCGKSLSEQNRSTIGAEKISNWSLQAMSEESFVRALLENQPFIPKYFPFDVSVNKHGAPNFQQSIAKVKIDKPINAKTLANELEADTLIIDTRPQEFIHTSFQNSINLMGGPKFETWLGSIVNPGERFYLIAENESVLCSLIVRAANIGYEPQIEKAFAVDFGKQEVSHFNSKELSRSHDAFTIVDVRNESEVKERKIFKNSINIPLNELRDRVNEIPLNKPIVVHCAGGYRSAAGTSIIKSRLNGKAQVFDLSEDIEKF
ncbi:MAG: MBL fold metallo-hydrolase [Chitinophagales bacterium]